jgi:hypothetical protein
MPCCRNGHHRHNRLEAILGGPLNNRFGMTEAHGITSLPIAGQLARWASRRLDGGVTVYMKSPVPLRILVDSGHAITVC